MKKKIKTFILLLNVLLAVITVIAFLAPSIHPAKNIFFAFAGLIFPWLIALHVFAIGFWLLFNYKWAFISLITIGLGWSQVNKYFSFNGPNSEEVAGSFSVVSYNLQHGYEIRSYAEKGPTDRSVEFSTFLKNKLQADVFCGQEISLFANELINKTKLFPYQHRLKEKGAVIYSRFPIINSGQIDFNTKTNSCLWADIAMPDCTYRVYSYHLQSNNITKDADKVIEKGDIQDSETWIGVRNILGKYKRSTRIRSKQAEMIQDHVSLSPHPVILTGDMNDPPQSFVYGKISNGFNDSFLAKGFGFGTTFAGRIPSLRIDYIFADPSFKILEHRVFNASFSDHFPIRAKIICSDN